MSFRGKTCGSCAWKSWSNCRRVASGKMIYSEHSLKSSPELSGWPQVREDDLACPEWVSLKEE